MRHRQAQRSYSIFIANAWPFRKIMISVGSHLAVNTPLDCWASYTQILAHWKCALFAEPSRTWLAWWLQSSSHPSHVRLRCRCWSSSSTWGASGGDRVPLLSPSKYPATRRLVWAIKVTGTLRRLLFYTLNTSSMVTPMRPCDVGNQEPIGYPDEWCRRLREWLNLQLSMSGSDGDQIVTSL